MWETSSQHVRVPVEFLRLVRSSNDIHLLYTDDKIRGKHAHFSSSFFQ